MVAAVMISRALVDAAGAVGFFDPAFQESGSLAFCGEMICRSDVMTMKYVCKIGIWLAAQQTHMQMLGMALGTVIYGIHSASNHDSKKHKQIRCCTHKASSKNGLDSALFW